MEQLAIDILSKLGVAGFAIFIMYRFHLNYMEAAKEEKKSYAELLEKTIGVIQENTHALKEVISFIKKS